MSARDAYEAFLGVSYSGNKSELEQVLKSVIAGSSELLQPRQCFGEDGFSFFFQYNLVTLTQVGQTRL